MWTGRSAGHMKHIKSRAAIAAVLSIGAGCGDNFHAHGGDSDPPGGDPPPDSAEMTAANISITGDGTSLVGVPVGAAQAFHLTATNSGTAPATLGTIDGVDAPFRLDAGTCAPGGVLAAQESCTIDVVYAPTVVGPASGSVHLAYADSSEHSATYAFDGSSKSFTFTTGQASSVVIGQPDFVSNDGDTTATKLYGPWGDPSIYNGKLYITDWGNNRILGYNSIPSTMGPAADFVLGQTDFTGYASGTTASTFSYPWSSSAADGVFAVADTSNNRVLLFAPVPTTMTPAASAVLGQTSMTESSSACTKSTMSAPTSVSVTAGKLVVTDYSNNRVLIWNSIPTTTTDPDLVLGQPDFTTCGGNTGGTSATSLLHPGDVWSNGTMLIVADSGNHRMLVWRTFPTTNAQPADLVLGQADFTGSSPNRGGAVSGSGFDSSSSHWSNVTSNGAQIFYSDYNNSRILIWNTIPTTNGAAADTVIGQTDMTSNAAPYPPTASSVAGVGGVTFYGNQFIVTDYGNNRVMIFDGQ